MMDFSDLILALDAKLKEYNYVMDPQITIPNVEYIAYINDRNVFKVKNLCSVIDLPDNLVDLTTTRNFIKFLKKSLLDQYGDAFLWKELEMCLVVLCADKVYALLRNNDGKIMDEASFSLSAMLGTCFINKDVVDSFSVSSWGVYFSGDHFKAVDEIVKRWTEEKKTVHEN